jgi:hypothetical protein
LAFSSTAAYAPTAPPQQPCAQQPIFIQRGSAREQLNQPRLVFFITRSNGCIVPLVPIDELPFSVRLESVPRNINPEQTFGMPFLSSLPYTGMVFKAKDNAPASLQPIPANIVKAKSSIRSLTSPYRGVFVLATLFSSVECHC